MSKPTPGTQYTVQNGDTIERIAATAYGDAGRSAEIIRANPSIIVSPGVVLILPPDEDLTAFTPSTDGLGLFIGGREIPTENMRIMRSLDSIANGWTATIAWQLGDDPALDALIRPYRYADASVFINSTLAIAGRVYGTAPGLGGRSELNLEGWSFAADLIDSTLKAPYESNNVTLSQRVKEVAAPFNLKVESDLETDGKFDRVTATSAQRAGDHLLELSSQRGALINSDPDGALRIFKVTGEGESVGTIEEGTPGFSGFEAGFDGRARFNAYIFLSQTPGDPSTNATAVDKAVPVTRFMTFSGNDTTTGEAQQAADWRKTKALADALTIPIQAEGFKAPNGKEWAPGQTVTLISPTLFMPDGFEMLIRSTEMVQAPGGEGTTLNLVPPGVYTGADIVEPWLSE